MRRNFMIKVRAAVILMEGDRILLVKHSKSGKEYWVLPGGGVEEGESLVETAAREIKEETNLEIKVKKLVFISEAIPPDKHRHVIDFFFTGEILSGEIKMGEEDILKDIKFFPVSALSEISFCPDIREELKEGYDSGFSGPPQFLGNKWQ
jgi:ADP-ribose pyrophosphatase YjhB (NUDIX family)